MYSITQFGKQLSKSKYTIDEKTKTFSTNEDNLVLDFSGEYGWTFDTSYDCTFKTGSNCTFDTGSYCVVIRRDIYEVIELEEGKKIKLNGYSLKGFTVEEDDKTQEAIKLLKENGYKIVKE